jgi:hypothetical protein
MYIPHPNHHPADYFTTTTRASFPDPKVQAKPNFRTRNQGDCTFDNSQNLKFRSVKGESGFPCDTHFTKEALNTLTSGYTMNRQHWDGSGWGTEANQHTDQMRTTYRLGFNQPKPFHKMELRNNDGRIKQSQIVFDLKDKYSSKATKLPFDLKRKTFSP